MRVGCIIMYRGCGMQWDTWEGQRAGVKTVLEEASGESSKQIPAEHARILGNAGKRHGKEIKK